MVVRTIVCFFIGMTVLAMTLIVVESPWVVATVGIAHIVGSAVLGVLIVRQLRDEERATAEAEARAATGSPS